MLHAAVAEAFAGQQYPVRGSKLRWGKWRKEFHAVSFQ